MPAGHHDVDRVAGAEGGAERDLGERAEVGVVVEVDGQVAEAAAQLGRDREALPAGQDRRRADRAALVVDRPRERHADAEHAVCAEAGLGEQVVDELGGAVERALGGVVDVLRAHRLGEHGAREVGDGDVDVVVAEVDADHRAGRAVEREQRRRAALAMLAGASGSECSTTSPCACRSATRLETVERDRPVTRAICARLAVPRSRRVSTTRRRLSSRSDSSDPVLTPRRPSRTPRASVKSPDELSRKS